MKKLLLILTILFFLGAVGSAFISQNLSADPITDPPDENPKDPRVDYGGFIICYNLKTTDCK